MSQRDGQDHAQVHLPGKAAQIIHPQEDQAEGREDPGGFVQARVIIKGNIIGHDQEDDQVYGVEDAVLQAELPATNQVPDHPTERTRDNKPDFKGHRQK
jgi:hypothetical protein